MTNCKLLLQVVFLLLFAFPKIGFGQSSQVNYSFTLSSNASTSAGVFAKDGTLITTLWSGVKYNAGTYNLTWDGRDDNGNFVPNGNYDIKVLSNNVVYTWEGVVGNTSASSSGSTVMHAFQTVNSIAILGTTAYYTTNYNETGTATFRFNTNAPQAKTSIMDRGGATNLVATDGKYVYWNGLDPYSQATNYVYATNVSDDAEVMFAAGASVNLTYTKPMLSAIDVVYNNAAVVTGLAVQKNGQYLFAAHKNLNQLHVLNKTTGTLVQSINITSPGGLAVDANDNLLVITGSNVVKYTVNGDGTLSAPQFTISGFVAPLALAVSPDNNTIVVADGGNSQQLKSYNNNTGAAGWTFGQAGGYANGPDVTNDKFYFSDLDDVARTSISFAPDGSFWVSDPGNNRTQHYAADRSYISRVMFMPHFYGCSVDANNSTRAFADYLEFKIDYSKPLAPDNDSWVLVKNWGFNIPSDYRDQSRLRQVNTLSNGRTYVLVRHADKFAIAELPASGPIRFTGVEIPDGTYSLYPDGSLRSSLFANIGSTSGWKCMLLNGFDASNNPLYGPIQILATAPTATATDPLSYGSGNAALTSSNVVVSFDAGLPPFGSSGYHLGGIKLNDNKWLWRTAASTTKDYSGPFPADGSYDIGNRVQYAGSVALTVDRNIIWGYHGEFWKNSQTNKWNHVYDDGLFVGQFGVTGPEVLGQEAAAMMAGNALTGALVKDANGNAYLYHPDEFTHSGLHRWKISGLNTIKEQTIPVTFTIAAEGLLGMYYDGFDINNFNNKSARLDSVVNFNWGAALPSGAKVSGPVYSARWTGYVKPFQTDNYTFYTKADQKVRLWIGDSLLIDHWNNNGLAEYNSPVINLTAGKMYSVRMEYGNANPTGASTAVLSWSAASVAKQVIPATNLYKGNEPDTTGGLDMMEGLFYNNKVLQNNLYGWFRTPVAEDYTALYGQYWSSKSGVKSIYNSTKSPDVYTNFSQNSGVYSVTRDLGTPDKTITSWKLYGNINFEENNANTGTAGGSYLEMLDENGKILTRFQTILSYENGVPYIIVMANNTQIYKGTTDVVQPVLFQPQPLEIVMSKDGANITYGPYAQVQAGIFDASANWQAPKTMRLYFYCNGANYSRVMDLNGFRFALNGKVTVTPPNTPPVANAGTDITITLPTNTATLDGSASSDSDGSIASYSWAQVSGPNTATIANGNTAKPSLSGLVQGTYVFELTVTDNKGATAKSQVKVIVNPATNKPPVANAGSDITITLPINTATLDGTASSDTDGTIVSYAWAQLSGPSTATMGSNNTAKVSLSALVQGTYVFELTVTDDKGATAKAQVKVIVNAAANTAPVANAGTDITITLPTNTATLDGSASSDADGSIASYGWAQLSGPGTATMGSNNTAKVSLSALAQGTYVFELTVTDNKGATAKSQVKVTVNPAANIPPVANAGTDITITLPTNTATLDGSASSDADGSIASYSWAQLSGPSTATMASSNTAKVSLSALAQGTYVFELTVTDDKGATSKSQVKVTVNPAANIAPVANAGTDITITLPINIATLDGSASSDADGSIASYSWAQLSGPSTATMGSNNTAKVSLSALVQGTYVFELTVTDNKGATAKSQVKVTVNPAANIPPVANAGADISITLPTNTTSLDGSASSDADGSIATYSWAQLSGPNTANIANSNSAKPSLSGLVQGTYVFELTVTDNKGATSTDQVKVIVNPANNIAPVANAGTDISITLPVNTSTLDGAASSDADGSIAGYAWVQLSGPSTATMGSNNTATVSLTALVQGTYVFELTVTDDKGATATDQVKVVVNPEPDIAPVANAGTDITITLPVNTANLDGSASSDADGTIATYSWAQLSGPNTATIANGNSAKPSLSGLVQGTYVFELTVTDDKGLTAKDQVKVIVNPANNIVPVANAGADISITLPTNTAMLDGSASSDADGTIATYSWAQLSGPNTAAIANGNTAKPSLSGLVQGTYVFELTVTDDKGATAKSQVKVTVNPAANIPPVANAGIDISITLPANTAMLDGSASSDADGSIASYSWAQLSGPNTAAIANGNSAKPSLSGLVQGTYVFELTVTDNKGATSTDQVKVIINPANNIAPIANAGKDITITLPVNTAALDGSASSDADGSIASYSWAQISGPGIATITGGSTAKPSLTGLVQGTYVFELTVTDDKGAKATAQVKVVVNPAANIPPIANAGKDTVITVASMQGVFAILDASKSSDPDGTITAYAWNQLSGPVAAVITDKTKSTTVVSFQKEGKYVFEVQVTDNAGAVSKATVTIEVINTFRYDESFKMYPNPASSYIRVEYTTDVLGLVDISVYDMAGVMVYDEKVQKDLPLMARNINLNKLPSSTYVLVLRRYDGRVLMRTFIKQ